MERGLKPSTSPHSRGKHESEHTQGMLTILSSGSFLAGSRTLTLSTSTTCLDNVWIGKAQGSGYSHTTQQTSAALLPFPNKRALPPGSCTSQVH